VTVLTILAGGVALAAVAALYAYMIVNIVVELQCRLGWDE
jgi:hypothetical protein